MVQQNEVVALVLGLGVLLFFVSKLSRFGELPSRRVFAAAFLAFFTGWLLTVVEGLWVGHPSEELLASLFNGIEHAGYAMGSILLLWWCARIHRERGGARS